MHVLEVDCQAHNFSFSQVVQLQELFDVRHSVFILGNAGTGKSCVWNTLKATNRVMGKKPTAVDLDPKSVTNDELFGVISPATREWKDGKRNLHTYVPICTFSTIFAVLLSSCSVTTLEQSRVDGHFHRLKKSRTVLKI